ncbi:uncharacterized protein I303_102005 [Kwoniella dejecticola CBS 10117]|uniref:Mob1 family protein n=1 Tax=Kwoniella dejecticola CBS 10117 TaxID=1296121 RepID=A0A1A6AC67_9TREE|nr:uncharacterized protein I303_01857 [Kwoniella dejecticola CBS 10117]OBR87649.1 hypothetical protein I303_01857 [Kwoniella dejecticola CBS 10117]
MIIPPQTASQGESSIYRLRRGTKLSEIPPLPPNPPVPDLSSLNGPFQLAEYLSLKVRHDPHDVVGLVDVPVGDKSVGGKGPDRNVWIYEHLRRIPIDLTPLLTALLPICNRETCPDMKAHEWLYLCSAHGGGAESCSAIDYILHTLDSTTALLNSSQNFPSRMQIPPSSVSHFPSLFRRLSRIFSHAYYHHREVFQLSEGETSLYARFVGLCEKYELVGASLLPIPREVIGSHLTQQDDASDDSQEEEEEQEEEDRDELEEDEDEDKSEGEARGEGRGRQDGSGSQQKERRTQSLDRSLPPSTTVPPKTENVAPIHTAIPSRDTSSPVKPPAPTRNETLKADSFSAGTLRDQPKSPLKFGGKGTLGRGKQPRATMHWAGESDVPNLPGSSANSQAGATEAQSSLSTSSPSKGRDRSESIESAIHIPEGLGTEPPEELREENLENIPIADQPAEEAEADQDGQTDTAERVNAVAEVSQDGEDIEEEEIVPKDEIELLEEKGELRPDTTVAPLSPPTVEAESAYASTPASMDRDKTTADATSAESQGEDKGDNKMEDKDLSSTSHSNADEQKQDSQSSSTTENAIELDTSTTTTSTTSTPSSGLPKLEVNPLSTSTSSPSPSPLKGKKRISPKTDKPPSAVTAGMSNSSNSPIPSPIKGKGKLVPAEISSPSKSSFDDQIDKKEKEQERGKERSKSADGVDEAENAKVEMETQEDAKGKEKKQEQEHTVV